VTEDAAQSAFLSRRTYHTPDATPDKLDYSTLAEVTLGLRGMVTALATEG
jgi:hypothetical protein